MGSLGMPEILMILVIALIIFGPRKLPELGKTLGQSLAQFRRASEDFKRQWEDEVEMERRRVDYPPPQIEHAEPSAAASTAEEHAPAGGEIATAHHAESATETAAAPHGESATEAAAAHHAETAPESKPASISTERPN